MSESRYIVLSLPEAKASGKRAAGFQSLVSATGACATYNAGGGSQAMWGIGPHGTVAIVDTHSPADAPGAGEGRRPVYGALRNMLDSVRSYAGHCPVRPGRFHDHTDQQLIRCANDEGAR